MGLENFTPGQALAPGSPDARDLGAVENSHFWLGAFLLRFERSWFFGFQTLANEKNQPHIDLFFHTTHSVNGIVQNGAAFWQD